MFALAVSADDTLFLVCSLPLLCPLVPERLEVPTRNASRSCPLTWSKLQFENRGDASVEVRRTESWAHYECAKGVNTPGPQDYVIPRTH